MTERFDTIVIGGGIGGLATAALLQYRKPNERVLLLEAHSRSGGCASGYDRYLKVPDHAEKMRFTLDVGATTLSGLGGDRPVERLLRELSLSLDAVHIDPGIIVTLTDGSVVRRFAGSEKWYAESARVFGERTVPFWQEIDRIAKQAWSVSTRYPRFPFTSFGDLVRSGLSFMLADLALLKLARPPLLSLIQKHGLEDDRRFRDFVDQLLMISVQCTSVQASTLVAALGLEYPAHTFYLKGGLYQLAQLLESSFKSSGGELRFKSFVTTIDYDISKKRYTVTDAKGRTHESSRLISNATLWDSIELLGDVPESFRSSITKSGGNPKGTRWGALMLTGVIADRIDDGGSLYHQFHTSEGSLFLSLSDRNDTARIPAGWRSVSVSAHEADPERWFAMDEKTYEAEQRNEIARFEAVLTKHLPHYATSAKLLLELGTPRTFQFYTHRKNGWVGGIAHSVQNWMPSWQTNKTQLDGFYLVGDTVFPGQGTPAVVQSAINLCDRILSEAT